MLELMSLPVMHEDLLLINHISFYDVLLSSDHCHQNRGNAYHDEEGDDVVVLGHLTVLLS